MSKKETVYKKMTVPELVKELKNTARYWKPARECEKENNVELAVCTEKDGYRYVLRYNISFGYLFGLAISPDRVICLPFLEEDSLDECIEKFVPMLEDYFKEYSIALEEDYDGTVLLIEK